MNHCTKPSIKPFNFDERATLFAKECRMFVRKIPRIIGVEEDGRQLIRSSGSIGANYAEAQEGMSRKDSLKSLRIARKEAKESVHWLIIFQTYDSSEAFEQNRIELANEAKELINILTSMIKKVERR